MSPFRLPGLQRNGHINSSDCRQCEIHNLAVYADRQLSPNAIARSDANLVKLQSKPVQALYDFGKSEPLGGIDQCLSSGRRVCMPIQVVERDCFIPVALCQILLHLLLARDFSCRFCCHDIEAASHRYKGLCASLRGRLRRPALEEAERLY